MFARFAATIAFFAMLVVAPVFAVPAPQAQLVPETADGKISLLVEVAPGSAASVAARVEELGGRVTYRFEHLDAIAVTMPRVAQSLLAADPRVRVASRQHLVRRAIHPIEIPAALAHRSAARRVEAGIEFAYLEEPFTTRPAPKSTPRGTDPESFFGYDVLTGAAESWAATGAGEGVVVAIIDTGIYPDHPMLQGNVLGGINLVPEDEEQAIDADGDGIAEGLSFDWNAVENNGHGTFCAGLVAGHVDLVVPAASVLAQSVALNSPKSIEIVGDDATIRLRGTAPSASLYSIKIFPYDGGSSPDARVAEAIDRLITMKTTGELDVDIISMSLSGPVLFDGGCALDRIVDVASLHGITCVSAASNEGPSLVTVGSPGSASSSVTCGAAMDPIHTRVVAETSFGLPLGFGSLLYPTEDVHLIEFSSRGSTADGRVKPDLIATGFSVFSSGLRDVDQNGVNDTPAFGFGSGTSFSTPTIAGAAALVTAYGNDLGALGRAPFVANVLKKAAIPIASKDLVSEREQGRGFVNIPHALELMDAGAYLSPGASDPTHVLMSHVSLLHGDVSGSTPDLAAGESYNVFIDVPPTASKIVFEFPTVTLAGESNPVLEDAMGAVIHTAKRGGSGDYVFGANTFAGGLQAGTIFELENPEPGTMRLTFSAPGFNMGTAAASYNVHAIREAFIATKTFEGSLHPGVISEHEIEVPAGLAALCVQLSWRRDWTKFPTVDLDLFAETPDGILAIASIDSPEFAVIEDPAPGTWTISFTDLGSALGDEPYKLETVEVLPQIVRIEQDDEFLGSPRILAATPNPATGPAEVSFTLPAEGRARLRVFDVAGRVVRTLVDGPMTAGAHSAVWDRANDAGDRTGPGVYFLRLDAAGGTSVRKVAVVK